ncbi:MAG: M4 family metallopeptidase [Tenacibaculum sp.]|nr:M4 family metallopeptidase [Tenacibaculum sp.]
MRCKLLLLVVALVAVTSAFGQQKRLKKVSLTKVGKLKKRLSLQSILNSEFKGTSGTEFRRQKSSIDKQKNNHETFQQYFQGLKVEYGQVKIHKKNGEIDAYNGKYYDVANLNTSPRLSESSIISIAAKHMGNTVFWPGDNLTKLSKPKMELLILPSRRSDEINLAYAVTVGATKPVMKLGVLYIDANNGSILKYKNQLFACFENHDHSSHNNTQSTKRYGKSLVASASGFAAYTGSVSFETKSDGSNYILNDETRAASSQWNLTNQGLGNRKGIITVDMRNGTDYVNGPIYDFTDADNNWSAVEMATDDNIYAIDVHWGTTQLYDYWKNEHNWNSYNGSNSALLSMVHYDADWTNAAWGAVSNTAGFMLYGDGAGKFTPLTTLDVIAHEIAHGINNATSNLDYEYESGALNEGLSDIWAMVFENYANDNLGTNTDPSRINDQNAGGALRSFSNPNSYGQPDTYGGTYWYDTTNCTPSQNGNDYCGVHTNSGVLNHWFWLLYNGGSGTNDIGNTYSVTAINVYDAADIVWQMQQNYLTSTSDYTDARVAAIQAATDLYGACSQEVTSVTNAFYAVGVGEAHVPVVPEITTSPANATVEVNGTVQFTVEGVNFTSAQWLVSEDGNAWNTRFDDLTVNGKDSTTIELTNVPLSANGYKFRVYLADDCGNDILSSAATLTVKEYTTITDSNFETALEDLGYDDISGDGKVPTDQIEGITSLDISNKSISNLSGIEDFVALQSLIFNNNTVTSVDLSNNTELTVVSGRYNGLESIDITGCTKMDLVLLENNNLKNLDITKCTALTRAWVQNNDIETFDPTKSPLLRALGISNSNLTSLDLTQNTALQQLYAGGNAITDLDLSKNTVLRIIGVNNNNLSSLNIKNGNNSNVTNFTSTGNANLTCITVDDPSTFENSWSSTRDSQSYFADHDCRYTDIPDTAFEAILEDQGYDDISQDGKVPTSSIETIKYLDLDYSAYKIKDLTGIEDFVAVQSIFGDGNELSTADFSNNLNLLEIYLEDSPLTSLNVSLNTKLSGIFLKDAVFETIDLSTNTELTHLSIDDSALKTIDLSANTKLKSLSLTNVNLTSVDLSTNTNLQTAYFYGGKFNNLDFSKNTQLKAVWVNDNELTNLIIKNGANSTLTSFRSYGNTNLTCIAVSDKDHFETKFLGDIDNHTSFTDAYCNYTSIPDSNFESALENLGYDDISGDGQVPTDLIETVTEIQINFHSIEDLTGIEDFTALEELDVLYGSIQKIDVSQNLKLTRLWCGYNVGLETLDVSNNVLLENLFVNDTDISVLDLSKNSKLTNLVASSNNDLSQLNLQNGNNLNVTNLLLTGTPNLTCIQVDDATYSSTNWTSIDAQNSFSEDCESCTFNARVILEGPFNSSTFEMNDNLRTNNLLPTTSPYSDGATCEASVLENSDAVDWIEIQLRSADDINTIIAAKSFLLEKNSGVSSADGISDLSISAWQGNYYVAVVHRNHLTVVTKNPIIFDGDEANVDFTSDGSVLNGSNALVEVIHSVFALPAGNVEGIGQIQNSGVNSTILQLGNSGYSIFDVDMNGQIQNTDINIIRQNLGRGEQIQIAD